MKAPDLAAVAAATAGLAIAPHIPKDGMFVNGTKSATSGRGK